jgi:hypothetical protein
MRSAPGPTARADLAVAQDAERVSMGFRHPHILGHPGSWTTPCVCARNRRRAFLAEEKVKRQAWAIAGLRLSDPCPDVSTGENATASRLQRLAGALCRVGLPTWFVHRGRVAVRQAMRLRSRWRVKPVPDVRPHRSRTAERRRLGLLLECGADPLHFFELRRANLGKAQIQLF